MHASVNASPIAHPLNYHDLLAHAASYAACASTQQLQQAIQLFEDHFPEKIVDLIDALTPFDALTALHLSQKYKIYSLHTVALLLRQKQKDHAQQLLKQLSNKKEQNVINFSLLQAQLHFQLNQPSLVLGSINTLYKYHHLQTLSILNLTQPINVTNIDNKPVALAKCKQDNLISILITTYNCENYISSTLESLLHQSYQAFEIIIVDDNSNDNTWSILQSYAQKDQRIQIYQQPLNLGTYVAKNKALLVARGDFVICHDSDDWSHPQRLERQIEPLLQNKKLIATTSEWFRLSDEGEVYARSVFPISRLNPSSPMFRRKLVMQKLGFWDNVRTGADSEFLARLKLIFGKKAVHKIAIPLAIGSHHERSLMNAPETGFTSQSIPPSRLEYWESWSLWHIAAIKQQTSLYVPLNPLLKQRKFEAPQSIVLDDPLLLQYQNQTIYQD